MAPQIEIHNGEILVDGQPAVPLIESLPIARAPTEAVEDVEPEDIARRMAQTISLGVENKLTPMEIVNSLLTLNSPRGHKLVWTRFDVHQTFALWTKKMEGRGKR